MFAHTHWPLAGHRTRELLVGLPEEVDSDLDSQSAWKWRALITRAEVEMIERMEIAPAHGTSLVVEVWRVDFHMLGSGWQHGFLVTSELELPTTRFYRAGSYATYALAREEFESLRHVRQAIRTLS